MIDSNAPPECLARRRCLALLLVVWLAASGAHAEQAPAAPGELAVSSALGPAYPQGQGAATWARLVDERSGGRIKLKHYPGATRVGRDPARELGALREGTIAFAVGSSLVWSSEVKELDLFALPWLVTRFDALGALFAGETGARLFERLERAGVKPLAWGAAGFYELATREAVHGPEDVRRLTLRVPASSIMQETLAAFGAASGTMTFADATTRLRAGILDGEETSIAAYEATRGYALGANQVTLWHAHAEALIFAVNPGIWEALSDADRELVRAAAQDAARQASDSARARASRDALSKLAASGALVVPLSDAGIDAFRRVAQPVYRRWAPAVGEDLVRTAEREIAGVQGVPAPAAVSP